MTYRIEWQLRKRGNSCPKQRKHIKVTYSTLGSPDPLLHEYFRRGRRRAKGESRPALSDCSSTANGSMATGSYSRGRSPINTDWLLGTYAQASAAQVDQAVAAAKAAFPGWRATPWQRALSTIVKRFADLISERLFEISAAVSMEVGKNRLEAIGDVEESRRPHPLLRRRHAPITRASTVNCSARSDRALQPQRAQALRRLGRHRSLQFPSRADRRTDRRRAHRRQHRRA